MIYGEQELPEKWYIRINSDNRKELNNYLIENKSKYPSYTKQWEVQGGYFYSEQPKASKCHSSGIIYKGFTEITQEQFNKFIKNKLPEFWYVKVTKNNKDILQKWVEKQPEYDRRFRAVQGYVGNKNYDSSYQDWNSDASNFKQFGAIEITFEQFKKYILKEETMEKKIIGYKAPMDLGGHRVKGLMFTKTDSNVGSWYNCRHSNGSSSINIPGEIVETWEPVYEEEKIMLPESKYEIEIKKSGILIDNHSFTKSFLEAAKIVTEHSKADVIIGCGAKNRIGSANQWKLSYELINKILDKINEK